MPSPTTLDTVFALHNLTYLAFTLKLLKKQGNNQITVKQRKNGNSSDTHSNEFYEDAQKLVTFLNDKHLGTTS